MHYHQPCILVDLVAGPRTSSKTMDTLKRYVKSCGMTYVVLKKEKAGYLHNAMFVALISSGMVFAAMGLDFKDVDRSWMLNQKSEVGPFGMLDQVGLTEEAEALLTERMDETHAPYYFMSVVAGMKKDADRPEEAVDWYRKAYDSARGRYSRFRWGSIYLSKVMALTPEDTETIESDSVEILDELLTLDDAFAGGNY